jgi:hypothetical protein
LSARAIESFNQKRGGCRALTPAQPRSIASRVSWIVRDSAGSANFSLTLEASDVPSLASASPASVSAYGGGQLTFILSTFSRE